MAQGEVDKLWSQIDEEDYEMVIDTLGNDFTKQQICKALIQADHDADDAINLLLEGGIGGEPSNTTTTTTATTKEEPTTKGSAIFLQKAAQIKPTSTSKKTETNSQPQPQQSTSTTAKKAIPIDKTKLSQPLEPKNLLSSRSQISHILTNNDKCHITSNSDIEQKSQQVLNKLQERLNFFTLEPFKDPSPDDLVAKQQEMALSFKHRG
mmetsp:Transcript_29347/g.33521  ORF Transcript_29347/g.33521 Transcript_29347/m.33521 type:complete len:208 (+) Transcript_29347:255-878(+)|eukprot:CAMPEP_0115000600 /NCGR_PEP_ID=MMETSP0216-20121206/16858_1 /TAXON_ID=223996 /ORGANISM="Protocruzia adherens, Strain Boccale" /LENGTH=207 /DNA_ID=CAMNT_0002365737 /DNA_START=170 /DNA_END=793 /DNA_ORIENTATION=-